MWQDGLLFNAMTNAFCTHDYLKRVQHTIYPQDYGMLPRPVISERIGRIKARHNFLRE
jgi:hypothetical protein